MILPLRLPSAPGCYLFSDDQDTVIYIGKAKNLEKRVASYFRKKDLDQKTTRMVSHIASVDFIVTGSEVEALILENSLIKRHQPHYNIDLKDAKQYAYIQITNEPFPCIRIARRAGEDGQFFGPFVSAAARDHVFSMVKKTFRLRTCKKLTRRACLRHHIQSCSAPCKDMVSEEEYGELVKKASLLLKGKDNDLVRALKQEMEEKSRAEEFEQAMLLRDQIQAIERLGYRQDIARRSDADEDIINYHRSGETVYLMLFAVYKGTLGTKKEFVFEAGEEFLEEFLLQYYAEEEPPLDLVLPEQVSDSLREYLSGRKGRKVTVTVPKIGARKRLLDLVAKNIELVFFGDQLKLEELRDELGLGDLPLVIECFDISHLGGTSVVGSMVQFRNGKPDKRNYRRFRIKTVQGVDDVSAVLEVVRRRYTRLKKEGSDLPDLVVIDGGRGQLNAAAAALRAVGVRIPVIALAKREEQVYMQGHAHPLPLAKKEKASLFLQEIRDEAHRFAVAYHRLLRKKRVIA
ncbi:MAG: excinuclease ABC subunit UvrC [Methanoregulaceae archaeon]|nr:excinuclease ABC subunit UvrC [Methanoregulaceae archaeon]